VTPATVLTVLSSRNPVSLRELSRLLDLPESACQRIVQRLSCSGHLRVTTRGIEVARCVG